MNFFFDRCLGIRLARMIAAFDEENQIHHQDDDIRFESRTLDVDLIRLISADEPKPVWVTADLSQRKDAAERLALKDSGMHLVFFARKFNSQPPHDQAIKLLTVWPNIVRECARARLPSVFEISNQIHNRKVDQLGPVREYFSRWGKA